MFFFLVFSLSVCVCMCECECVDWMDGLSEICMYVCMYVCMYCGKKEKFSFAGLAGGVGG